MLKDKLIELDIKITELANYLDTSRPTLYKYIELFDDGEIDKVPRQFKKLFKLINESPLIDKLNVIEYIISNKKDKKKTNTSPDIIKTIKKIKDSNPDNEKILFVYNVLTTDLYDFLIPYMNNLYKDIKENDNQDPTAKILTTIEQLKIDINNVNKEDK